MADKKCVPMLLGVVAISIISSAGTTFLLNRGGVINASEINVIDKNGVLHASLGPSGALRLYDREGQQRFNLDCAPAGRMEFLDENGESVVTLNATSRSRCTLDFMDTKGNASVRIGTNRGEPERPRLELSKDGKSVWSVPNE